MENKIKELEMVDAIKAYETYASYNKSKKNNYLWGFYAIVNKNNTAQIKE